MNWPGEVRDDLQCQRCFLFFLKELFLKPNSDLFLISINVSNISYII